MSYLNKKSSLCIAVIALILIIGGYIFWRNSSTQAEDEQTTASSQDQSAADLQAIKSYSQNEMSAMKPATANLRRSAQEYFAIIKKEGFNYEAAWENNREELIKLVNESKAYWLEASVHYERNEGIVAGVPQLADFDAWLDATPTGLEDPVEARDWTLVLPDGRTMEKPGNLFHSILEPTLWGTENQTIGLQVDLDGDGEIAPGEVLPDANLFFAAATELDAVTEQLQTAINEWDPTVEDAFAALLTMIPTMNEYFEQWKISRFVTGESSNESSFVAVSRLFDVDSILNGLDVTYKSVSPLVKTQDEELHSQITSGFEDLISYVNTLYIQEKEGKQFTPEQAEQFGSEAQAKATELAGQVSQATALLNIETEQ